MHMQKEVVYAGFINMNVGKNITLSTKQINIDTGTKFYKCPITSHNKVIPLSNASAYIY